MNFRTSITQRVGQQFKIGLTRLVLAILIAHAVSIVSWGDQTWINSNPGSITTASNWSGNVVPNAQDATAIISSQPINPTGDFTLNGGITLGTLSYSNFLGRAINGVGSIVFDASSGNASYQAHGHSLDLNIADVFLAKTTDFSIDPSVYVSVNARVNSGGGLIKSGTGILALYGANTYTGGTTINAGSIKAFNTLGSATGSGPVTVGNSAALFIGDNTSSGAISGDITDNGDVYFARSDSTSYAGHISGSGNLQKVFGGTITLNATHSYTGGTFINSGTLKLGANDRLPDLSAVHVDGTLALNSFNETIGSLDGNGSVTLGSGMLTTGGNNTSTTFSGAISGSGLITKTGGGTMTLSGNNSYSGMTTISGGDLTGSVIANSGTNSSFGAGGSFAISNGATLHYTGVTASTNRSFQLNGIGGVIQGNNDGFLFLEGVVSGTGNLTVTDGPLFLFGTNNSYSGTNTVIEGASLLGNSIANIGMNSSFGRGNFVLAQGSIDYQGASASTNRTIALNGWGGVLGIKNATSTLIWNGEISGNATTFYKTGSGTLQLDASNTYNAATAISGGTLRLGASERIPNTSAVSLYAFNPVFNLNNFTETIGSLAGDTSGTVAIGTGSLFTGNDNTSTSYSGTISGSGTFTKTGTGKLTLDALSPFSGQTIISGGTLRGTSIGNIGVNSAFGTGNIAISNGAALEYSSSPAASTNRNISIGTGGGTIAVTQFGTTLTLSSGNVTGAGKLDKSGSGTLNLLGGHTYTGGTTVSEGTLAVNGSIEGQLTVGPAGELAGGGIVHGNVNLDGRLNPGTSQGILKIDGNYTQTARSIAEMRVSGVQNAGVDYHWLQVGGNVALDGIYLFSLINGFHPQLNDEFTFVTAEGEISGAPKGVFASNLISVDPNLGFVVIKNDHDLRLRFVAPTDVHFVDNSGPIQDWNVAEKWDVNRVPTTADKVELSRSQAPAVQRVEVTSADASAYQVTVHDQSSPITIDIKNGKTLAAAVGNVTIGQNAAIELGTAGNSADTGTLATAETKSVMLMNGGLLKGNGTVTAGNLMVSNGTVAPGFSVGHLDVTGNYQQGAGGTLKIDIEGAAADQHDTVAVTGFALLGGTLQIDATNLTSIVPGTTYPILTAGSISGSFQTIESTGNNNIYFRATKNDSTASAEVHNRGDMNGDTVIDNIDFDLFAYGLMNRSTSTYLAKCNCDVFPQQSGDFNGNGRLDFDDIAGFQNQLGDMGMSSAGLMLAIDNYLYSTPEPTAALLILIGGFFCAAFRRGHLRPV